MLVIVNIKLATIENQRYKYLTDTNKGTTMLDLIKGLTMGALASLALFGPMLMGGI